MKKKILSILLIAVVLSLFTLTNPAQAMTGSGTEVDPYMIYDVNDLQDMADNLTAYYELANDIDASATSGWNAGAGFIPVGNSTSPFMGHFDGGNFTISDLFIYRPTEDNIGLFGFTDNVFITNVSLSSCNITGDGNVGSLIGWADNTTVTNCHSRWGYIYGEDDVGGLIGYIRNYGTNETSSVSYCSTTLDVYPQFIGGGLIGLIAMRAFYGGQETTISNCYSSGDMYIDVGYEEDFGGLIGRVTGGAGVSGNSNKVTIQDSYSFGNMYVSGRAIYGGGFVGLLTNSGTDYFDLLLEDNCSTVDIYIEAGSGAEYWGAFGGSITHDYSETDHDVIINRCYATGSIYGSGEDALYCGAGFVYGFSGNMTDCFAVGDVYSWTDPAGFIVTINNEPGTTITNCYSSGRAVQYSDDIEADYYFTNHANGFIADDYHISPATITAGYWDISESGVTQSTLGVGLADMSSSSGLTTMAFAGFDFSDTGDWTNDSLINNGNPYLKLGVCSLETSDYFDDPLVAPEYVIDCPTCTDNLTSSGNFTSNETFSGGPPGFAVIDDAAGDSGAPPIWLWGWIGMFAIIAPGFFITYMERKFGSGNGNLLLRMVIALIVIGLLVAWGRFDWWMIVFYIIIAAAPALMSRQYDIGGAGGISHQGWIGFCATSWIGLTLINRILEGQFLTSSESTWWCSIQLFNEFRVFDLFTLPVLNFQFFTVGIPSLLRWDYSFFGGNAEMIQYLLYTVTAVVAFILFVIMVGLLFNAFRAR